jgi:hypothetical protein
LLVHPQSLCIWGLSLIAWVDHWVTSIFSILSYPFLSFPILSYPFQLVQLDCPTRQVFVPSPKIVWRARQSGPALGILGDPFGIPWEVVK